jgi:hypothetical protein
VLLRKSQGQYRIKSFKTQRLLCVPAASITNSILSTIFTNSYISFTLLRINTISKGAMTYWSLEWRPSVCCYEEGNEFNPLNAKLNAICHFLALLGAHHILHVSSIRVNVACRNKYRIFSVLFLFHKSKSASHLHNAILIKTPLHALNSTRQNFAKSVTCNQP